MAVPRPRRNGLRPRGEGWGRGHQTSARPLALAFTGLIVYASLYPFSGWFWPAGQPLTALLVPPWPPWHDRFDIWANLIGYLPLGLLAYVAGVRGGRSVGGSAAFAIVAPSALSWAMEFTQHFLPGRYPSLMDWALNSAGALGGVIAGVVVHAAGGVERWHATRGRWFEPGSGPVLALLLLWPPGFLFPAPVPFMQGPSWERVQEFLFERFADHPWRSSLEWLWGNLGSSAGPLSEPVEAFGAALGLLGPCLLAFSVTRPGPRRAALALLALAAGLAANTLSAALNFGPGHALAWITPMVPAALGAGLLLAAACLPLGQRACAALGLVALSAGVVLVAQAPSDPYYAESLQAWEQGRFVRFHGLAQWLGWLWPLAAGGALFGRIARAETAPRR